MNKVAIGLGSNVGDRELALGKAVELLGRFVQRVKLSQMIETPALLKPNAPESWNQPFFNAALIGETALEPISLLDKLQEIEQQMGREKEGEWSPRCIDLDILLYEDQIVESERLMIPHAEMLKRDFVMRPLAEVAPNWLHPLVNRSIQELADAK
jgi:2-amino-4-hydroxy-6-hydroxymethyldihydropteridine diphosphokinase